jgi:hypothetical protein
MNFTAPLRLRLLAPLLLARDAVVVAIHLGARTVPEEERCFCAGSHLRTVDATIAFERRCGPAFRYCRGRSSGLSDRLRFDTTLVFGVAIPAERGNDEQRYEALHMIDRR